MKCRWCFLVLSVAAGTTVGFLIGLYQMYLNAEAMREAYGWACGTGATIPLFFWTPIGFGSGWFLGALVWDVATSYGLWGDNV